MFIITVAAVKHCDFLFFTAMGSCVALQENTQQCK